jgi:hypothetical protein
MACARGRADLLHHAAMSKPNFELDPREVEDFIRPLPARQYHQRIGALPEQFRKDLPAVAQGGAGDSPPARCRCRSASSVPGGMVPSGARRRVTGRGVGQAVPKFGCETLPQGQHPMLSA